MIFSTINKKEFLNHCQLADKKSFLQSEEMATLLKKRGYTVTYLGLKNSQKEIVISSLVYTKPMTGGLYMELNSGPVATDLSYLSDFYRELQIYAKQKGVIELVVKPYQTYQTFDTDGNPISKEHTELITDLTSLDYLHDGLKTGYPGGEPDWHYVKDLTDLNPQTLLKSFSKKGRPLVKKSQTFGIKLKRLNRDELHLFKEITSSTSERREYSDKSLDYYQDFYDSFGDKAEFMVAVLNFQDYYLHLEEDQEKLSNKINQLTKRLEAQPHSQKLQNQIREFSQQHETFETRKQEAKEFIQKYGNEDKILAGSLFLYTPQEAVYLFSGSYPEFNKFYAPALLQEYVMQEAIKRGITFYNFLGIMGEFDGSDGVLRFKQNFNGYIVRKMGTFRYYPKPILYKVIQILKSLLHRS